MTYKQIKKYLEKNNITELGTFDGGNDSGWVEITTENDSLNETLVQEVHDVLGYGSWAGNFSANGTIRYKDGDIFIEGAEYNSDMAETVATKKLKIKMPDDAFIDSYNLYIASYEEPMTRVNIKNGFKTDKAYKFERELEQDIKLLTEELHIDYNPDNGHSWWIDENFTKSENIEISISKERETDINKMITL